MQDALPILRFLAERASRGERVVLVTLTNVTGSAARAPGEQMAVAEDGSAIGSFSGGCVEAAVIAEALDVLAAAAARTVRFGSGSPYIDIRLPCGGGIDLLFTPDPAPEQIATALALLDARRPALVGLSSTGDLRVTVGHDGDETGWRDAAFRVRHDPPLRIVIMGHGAEPGALLDLALAYQAEVLLLSPQASLVEAARSRGVPAVFLHTLGRCDALVAERWTAVIALFHDHDWETDLLAQALAQDTLFIGAMGSRKTQAERLRLLAEAGCTASDLSRIVGPVGLIHASRDPRTLAVSIMAQVVDRLEQRAAQRQAGARRTIAVAA